MVRICCSFAFAGAILLALSASAQEPKIDLRRDLAPRSAPAPDSSIGVVTPTPEMWFYQQERNRHDDPKLAVRRRAEARGEQRQQRLASSKWYGIYNSRPTVSPTPWFSTYSPSWVSNTYDPAQWRMRAVPVVANLPENARYCASPGGHAVA